MKTRHAARIAALQLLYQSDALADWSDSASDLFFKVFYSGAEWPELDNETKSYALSLFSSVRSALAEIDAQIVALDLTWSLARMTRVDRCILRLAIAEASLPQTVPVKVIIDEALNLAREYSGTQSAGFLNAALEKALAGQLLASKTAS